MNKKWLIGTLLLISLFQMGMVALAPVVSAMTTAFQGVSSLAAQMAMTFLNLILVIVAVFSGRIAKAIGRRNMCVIGMGLTGAVGILAPFCTVHFLLIYLWSAMLGAAVGLFVPALNSLMIDFLEPDERQKAMGLQTAFVNLGGMLLSFFSGILASMRWNNAYFVFLGAIPVMILAIRALPEKSLEPVHPVVSGPKNKIPASVWLATLQTTVFAILYFAFSTNVSLLMQEKGFLSTSVSGSATALFMLGGCLAGFVFNRVVNLLHRRTPSLAFLLLAVSYLIIWLGGSLPLLFVGAFLGGSSLSFIFPYFVVTVAGKVPQSINVISTSLIVSIGPNLGSFVSPVIVSTISGLTGNTTVTNRFMVCALLAAVLGIILIFLSNRNKSPSNS